MIAPSVVSVRVIQSVSPVLESPSISVMVVVASSVSAVAVYQLPPCVKPGLAPTPSSASDTAFPGGVLIWLPGTCPARNPPTTVTTRGAVMVPFDSRNATHEGPSKEALGPERFVACVKKHPCENWNGLALASAGLSMVAPRYT